MTEKDAPATERPTTRRSPRHLLIAWGATLALEVVLYLIAWYSPAVTSLVTPLYVLALIPAAIVTWQWLRPRHRGARREGERRQLFRRSRKPNRP